MVKTKPDVHEWPVLTRTSFLEAPPTVAVNFSQKMQHRNRIDEITSKVRSLIPDAGRENWDGEGAKALDQSVVDLAVKLVKLFPDTVVEMPEVSATPHGEVYFDWVVSRDKMLALSVGRSPKHEVVFAGLLHGERVSGRQEWSGTFPCFLGCCFRSILQ